MDRPLLIGSKNKDKARELEALLEGLPWKVRRIEDYPETPRPVEDGDTFEANALKKAAYYGERFGVACVADDSGLAVDFLDGAPGVFSARYAGEACGYASNNAKLLAALAGAPWPERTARFICCAAIVFPDGASHVEMGAVEGHITIEAFGENGFGYDPIFVPAGQERTFAEMPPAQKRKLGHRGRAFRKMRAYLEAQG